jgi:hypothetical protein
LLGKAVAVAVVTDSWMLLPEEAATDGAAVMMEDAAPY